jgi:DNA-binding phage protein
MAKIKTLPKQKESSKKVRKLKIKKDSVIAFSPTRELLDEHFLGRAIIECLKDNDPEGVIEIISTYLETSNKMQSAQHASLSRSTLYHSLKGKNPTLRTLAKLMHASTLDIRK